MRRFAFVLRHEHGFSAFDEGYCLANRLAAEDCEPVEQLARRFVFSDRRCFFKQNIACVNRLYRAHNGYAALSVAVDNRPLNGRRASVFRQKRSVYVEYTEFRNRQKSFAQNLTERRGNHDVGVEIFDVLYTLSRHFFVLQNGYRKFLRLDFERRGFELVAAPDGFIKSCNHCGHGIYRIKFFKHRRRKVGTAHKHDFHNLFLCFAYLFAVYCAFYCAFCVTLFSLARRAVVCISTYTRFRPSGRFRDKTLLQ